MKKREGARGGGGGGGGQTWQCSIRRVFRVCFTNAPKMIGFWGSGWDSAGTEFHLISSIAGHLRGTFRFCVNSRIHFLTTESRTDLRKSTVMKWTVQVYETKQEAARFCLYWSNSTKVAWYEMNHASSEATSNMIFASTDCHHILWTLFVR